MPFCKQIASFKKSEYKNKKHIRDVDGAQLEPCGGRGNNLPFKKLPNNGTKGQLSLSVEEKPLLVPVRKIFTPSLSTNRISFTNISLCNAKVAAVSLGENIGQSIYYKS